MSAYVSTAPVDGSVQVLNLRFDAVSVTVQNDSNGTISVLSRTTGESISVPPGQIRRKNLTPTRNVAISSTGTAAKPINGLATCTFRDSRVQEGAEQGTPSTGGQIQSVAASLILWPQSNLDVVYQILAARSTRVKATIQVWGGPLQSGPQQYTGFVYSVPNDNGGAIYSQWNVTTPAEVNYLYGGWGLFSQNFPGTTLNISTTQAVNFKALIPLSQEAMWNINVWDEWI